MECHRFFPLLLVLHTAKNSQAAISAVLHPLEWLAFLAAPVEIPINRDNRNLKIPLKNNGVGEKDSIGSVRDAEPLPPPATAAAIGPVNIQFHTQNPANGTYSFGYDIGKCTKSHVPPN